MRTYNVPVIAMNLSVLAGHLVATRGRHLAKSCAGRLRKASHWRRHHLPGWGLAFVFWPVVLAGLWIFLALLETAIFGADLWRRLSELQWGHQAWRVIGRLARRRPVQRRTPGKPGFEVEHLADQVLVRPIGL
jgi:hypothetical protein